MEILHTFRIVHNGINHNEKENYYFLSTHIKDNKNNTIIDVHSWVFSRNNGQEYRTELYLSFKTNEHLVKKLNLPYAKHAAEASYMKGNKYFDNNSKKKQVKCLALGAGNVGKIVKSVIKYWQEQDYELEYVCFYRETGNHTNSDRCYKIRKEL
jgi:hypothetical protein